VFGPSGVPETIFHHLPKPMTGHEGNRCPNKENPQPRGGGKLGGLIGKGGWGFHKQKDQEGIVVDLNGKKVNEGKQGSGNKNPKKECWGGSRGNTTLQLR